MRPGGKVTVDLVYNRRILESEVDAGDFSCSAINKRGETSTSYDLDTTPAHILRKKIAMNDIGRHLRLTASVSAVKRRG